MSFVAHILVCCFTSCRRLCIICIMFHFVLIMNIGHHIHISIRVTSNINVVAKQGRCPQYKQFGPTNVCVSDSDCPGRKKFLHIAVSGHWDYPKGFTRHTQQPCIRTTTRLIWRKFSIAVITAKKTNNYFISTAVYSDLLIYTEE